MAEAKACGVSRSIGPVLDPDVLLPSALGLLGEGARAHTMVLIEDVADGGYARADEVFVVPEEWRARD